MVGIRSLTRRTIPAGALLIALWGAGSGAVAHAAAASSEASTAVSAKTSTAPASGARPALDPSPPPSTCAYPGTGSPSMAGLLGGLMGRVVVNGVKPLCQIGGGIGAVVSVPPQCQSYVGAPGRSSVLRSAAAFDGCVGFGWSTALDLGAASPQLTYLPLADDALDYAVLAGSVIPRTLTQADLKAVYTCDPAYVGAGPAYAVAPLLPGPGSGVRSGWEALMGITDADIAAGRYPCLRDTVNGTAVGENDGRVLTSTELVPYSVAAFLAQSDTQTPDQHGASVLGAFDGSAPTGVNPAATAPGFAVLGNGDIPRALATADLRGIYTCDPAYVGQGPNYSVTALLPAAGSALRTAWESFVGISDADVVAHRYPCVSDRTSDGRPVPEDDGRVLDARSIVPFSPDAYFAQMTGSAPDIRGTAQLGMADDVSPLLMTDSGAARSQAWLIVPTGQLATPLGAAVFAGAGAQVCQQAQMVELNGYAPDPDCGDTSRHTS